tara:strand:+ start:15550 stop:17187 length:1638 start_codon:yes stop_codon:yes gene_type:complete
MKLIRLTTTDENANFDSLFNEDIIINENSQIALQSLSIEDDYQEIEINGDNDNITFNLRVGSVSSVDRKITLNHTGNIAGQEETYNSNNYQILFNDIMKKLNEVLQSDLGTLNNFISGGVEIGTQWRCSVLKDSTATGKIQIEAKQSRLSSRYSDLDANITQRTLTTTGAVGKTLQHTTPTNTENAVWNKTENEPGSNLNTYMTYYQHSLTKGCGVFRVKISTFNGDDATESKLQSGAIIGVSSSNFIETIQKTDLLDTQISYGIHVDKKTGTYKVIKNGIWTDSGINFVYGSTAGQRPILEIVIELGRIRGKLYQDDGVGGQIITRYLFDEVYDNITAFYPLMIFRGKYISATQGVRFTQIRLSSDPYYDIELSENHYPDNSGIDILVGTNAPSQNKRATNCFFNFQGSSLMSFLGFNQLRYPNTGTSIISQFSITASQAFKFTDFSDAFIIIMDSIKLKSYDDYDIEGTRKGSRRDILSVVPYRGGSGNIIYEPNTLLFLDIDNYEKMYLREIRARILKTDYSPIISNGLTSMVLIIKDKNEK